MNSQHLLSPNAIHSWTSRHLNAFLNRNSCPGTFLFSLPLSGREEFGHFKADEAQALEHTLAHFTASKWPLHDSSWGYISAQLPRLERSGRACRDYVALRVVSGESFGGIEKLEDLVADENHQIGKCASFEAWEREKKREVLSSLSSSFFKRKCKKILDAIANCDFSADAHRQPPAVRLLCMPKDEDDAITVSGEYKGGLESSASSTALEAGRKRWNTIEDSSGSDSESPSPSSTSPRQQKEPVHKILSSPELCGDNNREMVEGGRSKVVGVEVVGEEIELYWSGDRKWYKAKVVEFNASKRKKRHFVEYEDGLQCWEDLVHERWRLLGNASEREFPGMDGHGSSPVGIPSEDNEESVPLQGDLSSEDSAEEVSDNAAKSSHGLVSRKSREEEVEVSSEDPEDVGEREFDVDADDGGSLEGESEAENDADFINGWDDEKRAKLHGMTESRFNKLMRLKVPKAKLKLQAMERKLKRKLAGIEASLSGSGEQLTRQELQRMRHTVTAKIQLKWLGTFRVLLERLESSGSVSDDKLLCFDNVYHELDARASKLFKKIRSLISHGATATQSPSPPTKRKREHSKPTNAAKRAKGSSPKTREAAENKHIFINPQGDETEDVEGYEEDEYSIGDYVEDAMQTREESRHLKRLFREVSEFSTRVKRLDAHRCVPAQVVTLREYGSSLLEQLGSVVPSFGEVSSGSTSKELRDKVRGMTQDLRYEISQLEDVSVDVEESGEKEVDLDEVIAERTRQEERSNKAIDRLLDRFSQFRRQKTSLSPPKSIRAASKLKLGNDTKASSTVEFAFMRNSMPLTIDNTPATGPTHNLPPSSSPTATSTKVSYVARFKVREAASYLDSTLSTESSLSLSLNHLPAVRDLGSVFGSCLGAFRDKDSLEASLNDLEFLASIGFKAEENVTAATYISDDLLLDSEDALRFHCLVLKVAGDGGIGSVLVDALCQSYVKQSLPLNAARMELWQALMKLLPTERFWQVVEGALLQSTKPGSLSVHRYSLFNDLPLKSNRNVLVKRLSDDEGAWDLTLLLVVHYAHTCEEPYSIGSLPFELLRNGPLLSTTYTRSQWSEVLRWHSKGPHSAPMATFCSILLDRISIITVASKGPALSLGSFKTILAAIVKGVLTEEPDPATSSNLSKALAQSVWLLFEVCASKTEANRLTNVLFSSLPKRSVCCKSAALSLASTLILSMAHQAASNLHVDGISRAQAQLNKLSSRFCGLLSVVDMTISARQVALSASHELCLLFQQCGLPIAASKDWTVLPLPRLTSPAELLVGITLATISETINGNNLQKVDDTNRQADLRRRRAARVVRAKGGKSRRGRGKNFWSIGVGNKERTRPAALAMEEKQRNALDQLQEKRVELLRKCVDALCEVVKGGLDPAVEENGLAWTKGEFRCGEVHMLRPVIAKIADWIRLDNSSVAVELATKVLNELAETILAYRHAPFLTLSKEELETVDVDACITPTPQVSQQRNRASATWEDALALLDIDQVVRRKKSAALLAEMKDRWKDVRRSSSSRTQLISIRACVQPLFQPLLDCLHVYVKENSSGLLELAKAGAHAASFCSKWSIVQVFENTEFPTEKPSRLVQLREARLLPMGIRAQVFADVMRLGGDPCSIGIGLEGWLNTWMLLTFDDLWNEEIRRSYLSFTRTMAEFAIAQEGTKGWAAIISRSLLSVLEHKENELEEAQGFALRLIMLRKVAAALSTEWTGVKQNGNGVRSIRIAMNGIFRNIYKNVANVLSLRAMLQVNALGGQGFRKEKQGLERYAEFVYSATKVLLQNCGEVMFVPGGSLSQNVLAQVRGVLLGPFDKRENGPHAAVSTSIQKKHFLSILPGLLRAHKLIGGAQPREVRSILHPLLLLASKEAHILSSQRIGATLQQIVDDSTTGLLLSCSFHRRVEGRDVVVTRRTSSALVEVLRPEKEARIRRGAVYVLHQLLSKSRAASLQHLCARRMNTSTT